MTARLFKMFVVAVCLSVISCADLRAETYMVGPGRPWPTVSAVADTLRPGDEVVVCSSLSDNATIAANGTAQAPISITGRIPGSGPQAPVPVIKSRGKNIVLTIAGNHIRVRHLRFQGYNDGVPEPVTAILHSGRDTEIADCSFEGFARKAVQGTPESGNITITRCTFRNCGMLANYHSVDLWSSVQGSTAIVEQCHFEAGTGGHLLKFHGPRNAARCNWFEGAFYSALQVTCEVLPVEDQEKSLDNPLFPMHTDIVGNVFIQRESPGSCYSILQLGGEHETAPGTEGDFNIAHNLFITSRGGTERGVAVITHGNVDRVRCFNNVFMSYGNRGSQVYDRETAWPDAPRTKAFIAGRRSGDPVVEGWNNWVTDECVGVPEGFKNTLRGPNPVFVNLVDMDFRPAQDSPLARAGFTDLPQGRVGPLVPQYEPRRAPGGNPRPPEDVPAIGPFAASSLPRTLGDVSGIILSLPDPKTRFPWPFAYDSALQKARASALNGDRDRALQWAKAAFIWCPLQDGYTGVLLEQIAATIETADGNRDRAGRFLQYAQAGPDGADAKKDTPDDLSDPLAGIPLDVLAVSDPEFTEKDERVNLAALVGVDGDHRWSELLWFKTERAILRINSGRFSDAAPLLAEALVESLTRPAGDEENDSQYRRNRSIRDRIEAALTAIHRSRTGTNEGVEDFILAVTKYATYGPCGPDLKMGTQDDLTPPM